MGVRNATVARVPEARVCSAFRLGSVAYKRTSNVAFGIIRGQNYNRAANLEHWKPNEVKTVLGAELNSIDKPGV